MPDVFARHFDVALSNFGLRYRNSDFIAEIVMPRVGTPAQSGFFPVWGREALQGYSKSDIRAPGASAIEVDWSFSTNKYFCDDHARKSRTIPYEETATTPGTIGAFTEPALAGTQLVQDQILGGHEVRTAALAFAAATYAAANKVLLSGTSQWSDHTNSKPILDIQKGKTAVRLAAGKTPNLLVLGALTAEQLISHPTILARLASIKMEIATLEDLARILQVDRVIVGSAISRSDAGVNTFIWGKHAALLTVEPKPTFFSTSFGKTFVWESAPMTVGGAAVFRWDEPDKSAKSFRVSSELYHDEQVVAADTGYLIENAVA